MSFYHHIFIVCNLMSRIKSNLVVKDCQFFFYFYMVVQIIKLSILLRRQSHSNPKVDFSAKAHICIMAPHVFLCVYYNNRGFKNAKNKERKWQVITETKKNKLNQIILGLSSYICCVLIYLKENDKSIDVYTLFNLNDMIKK